MFVVSSIFRHSVLKCCGLSKLTIVRNVNIGTRMPPTLYKIDGSPPANAVRMLAHILGVELNLRDMDWRTMEHKSPEYLKLNPLGTLPYLEDDGCGVSDSHAIMIYLLSKYGGAKSEALCSGLVALHAIMKYLLSKYGGTNHEALYPSEVRSRALVDQAMFFDAGVFFTALITVAGETFLGKIDRPTAEQISRIESSYSVLEAYLRGRPYVATQHLTLADLSTGATATAIQVMLKLDAAKYPRTSDWLSRLQEEHVFKTINAPGVAFFSKMITKLWEKNKLQNKQNKI